MPGPQFPQRGGPPGPGQRRDGPPGRPGPTGPGGPGGGGASRGPSGSGGARLQRAVPRYLREAGEDHFRKAPPGHTFRLYFGGWTDRWELAKEEKFRVTNEVTPLDRGAKQTLSALRGRHLALAKGNEVFSREVTSSAPFTTGLGIEHPLENGFAFLDPYGLPYLPGSSVKGVVRRAAEELALFETDTHGWSIPALWWLFGFDATSAYVAPAGQDPKPIEEERERWREAFRSHVQKLAGQEEALLDEYIRLAFPPKNGREAPDPVERVLGWIPTGSKPAPELREIHTRGALEFWDVLPEPKDGKLRVDIMNPHYNHYYQEGQPPGDWGSPVPIFFLTLPAGTRFTFIARFRPPRNWPGLVRSHFETPVDGKPRWHGLLDSAFAFAFDWLGFGAKAAIGYGRMASQYHAPHVEQAAAPPSFAPSGSRDHQRGGPVGPQRGTTAPAPIATSWGTSPTGGVLRDLERRIAAIATARDIKSEADALSNELVRRRSHPDAPRLAAALWKAVGQRQWLADRLRRNSLFADLVKKGGAE